MPLRSLFTNTIAGYTNNRNNFKSIADSLFCAHILDQPNVTCAYLNPDRESYEEMFAQGNLTPNVSALGVTDIASAIRILPEHVLAAMPDVCGPMELKKDLLQHAIDVNEFAGTMYDIRYLNYGRTFDNQLDTTIPESVYNRSVKTAYNRPYEQYTGNFQPYLPQPAVSK